MVTAAPVLPYRHGRYVLLHEIARGGMAVVYHAKAIGEEGFVKDVAVKRILADWSSDRQFVSMLIDEARVLTQLQHPNIVQVLELGVDQGIYFLAMEYIAGFDLRTFLQRLRADRVRLPEQFACFILLEILQGLAFAHSRVDAAGASLNIVHRDVSPQNVLVSLQGEVKIADFGIAKGNHRQQETTGLQVKGKFAYMAPEQACGETVDRRADLFAAGILFYELLSHERLFDGPNDLAVLERVRQARMPKSWETKFHPAVRGMLRRALAYEVIDRYPTAAQWYADLAQFVTQQQLATTRVAFAEYLQSIFPGELVRQQHTGNTPIPAGLLTGGEARPATKIDRISQLRKIRAWRPLQVGLLGVVMSLSLGMAFPGDAAPREPVWVARTVPEPAMIAVAVEPPVSAPPPVVAAIPVVAVANPLPASKTPPASIAPPKNVSNGKIAVQARPWGYVQIPGLLARRETPVVIDAPAGAYTVRVSTGNGASVAARAVVQAGKTATCQAVLDGAARMACH